MEASGPGSHSGASVLQTAAALVVVVAGLKLAAGLLVPAVFAALLLVLSATLAAFAGLTVLIGNSISDARGLDERLDRRIDQLEVEIQTWSDRHDLGIDVGEQFEQFRVGKSLGDLRGLIADVTQGVLGLFSDFALILLFMLLEANGFPAKLRRALGGEHIDLREFERVSDQVFDYVSVKAGMSFLTGALVAVLNLVVGVELAVIWGLVAFLFNFIPDVGSVLAAIPAVLMAGLLPELGAGAAILVALGYLAVNMLIGNALEPRIMGCRLGLSPLVVILNLVFWSWVWGPVGMLLSLPLTMVVKILLEHSSDGRPAAILLGPAEAEV